MNREDVEKLITSGSTFRLLGDSILWVITYMDGGYNMYPLNNKGWLDIDSTPWFNQSREKEYMSNFISTEGFIYMGNVFIDDKFAAEYI